MKEERWLTIIKSPHISEKSAAGNHEYQQYVFKVIQDATKPEVKKSIEHLFNVKVKSVCISNVKSKPRRLGQRLGRRNGWKKAYVTLAKGNEIDMPYGE